MTRRSRATALVTLLAAAALAAGCGGSSAATGPRVVVLGFDGLDYEVTRTLVAAGRMPNFARLAAAGGFTPLETSIPPQSPVAWSTFITGLDPGRHGIFDFIHRDPATMLPYLSTTRTAASDRVLTIGDWQLPLSGGSIELLRRGRPFWDVLEEHGIETTIGRMPANFPPSGQASRELSGMGTPDILGTYGTFSFYTSDASKFQSLTPSGGVVYPVQEVNGTVRAELEGPDNPFYATPRKVRAEFTSYIDAKRQFVKLAIGAEERLLRVGEWSDWVPVTFDLMPLQSLRTQARFYLKALEPSFELYVSPLNIDPSSPALPISSPPGYASDLARAAGRFYTQGIPEDTKSLRAGVLTPGEFLEQAQIARDENRRLFASVLDGFTDGFLFYYFGNVDQVSHMMWRPTDAGHPAYDPDTDPEYQHVVAELYAGLDAVVGDTLQRLDDDDLLIVMSDHGFTSWRRSFHLNSWLRDEGYLVLNDPAEEDTAGFFENVDWSRTRAYALGLNGLYMNVRGREAFGSVEPSARDALVAEISEKLLATIDPQTDAPVVSRIYRREDVYTVAGHEDLAPDLIVGYAKGTRGSDESALGGLPRAVLADNTDHWNGDHCMDHTAVPGILLTSRPLRRPAPSLQSLAASILAEFGIDRFPANEED